MTPPIDLGFIVEQSPEMPGYGGGKWAIYSAYCCWWTSFPEDLGVLPPVKAILNHETGMFEIVGDPAGHGLPCCPHCQSVLLQAPLKDFVKSAMDNPSHYGAAGLQNFVHAYSRNSKTCHRSWSAYERETAC